jgi:hypothetical protein
VLLAIPVLVFAAGAGLFWLAADWRRLIFLLPVLLSFDYRVRFSSFSFDFSELALLVAAIACAVHWCRDEEPLALVRSSAEGWLILGLAVLAWPGILLESNTVHAASVYRDFLLPFLLFFALVHAGLTTKDVRTLVALMCAFAVANACLGIVQYATGQFLWFAGPDEAEWQAYKTGLAKLSVFGSWLGVKDTLPVGLYTGTNMFGCFLSVPLCVTTTLAFSRDLQKFQRLVCLLAAAILLVCLLFTMFRSGLLVYLVSMMAVYLYLGRRGSWPRVLVVAALAVAAGLLFLSQGVFDWDQFGSLEGRGEMVSSAVALIKARPELLLTGGFGDLYHAQSRETQEIHNLALYSIVHFGLPATVLFFAFFLRLLRRAFRAVRSATGIERSVLVAVITSITANVFVYGSSTMVIDSVQTGVWLMFWAGMAAYLCSSLTVEQRAAAPAGSPAVLHAYGVPTS